MWCPGVISVNLNSGPTSRYHQTQLYRFSGVGEHLVLYLHNILVCFVHSTGNRMEHSSEEWRRDGWEDGSRRIISCRQRPRAEEREDGGQFTRYKSRESETIARERVLFRTIEAENMREKNWREVGVKWISPIKKFKSKFHKKFSLKNLTADFFYYPLVRQFSWWKCR